MRLAFMGSPDFAVPALRALHGAGTIAAVYCQPPARPAAASRPPCPVHVAAEDRGLPVRTPPRLPERSRGPGRVRSLDLMPPSSPPMG